mgnify:CR=1 FL=1
MARGRRGAVFAAAREGPLELLHHGGVFAAAGAAREVGLPLPLAPSLWKKGLLYSDHVAIRKRPGREVFAASFWSRRKGAFPKPVDGRKSVEVLALR